MVVGPIDTIEARGVGKVPLYLLRFGADGRLLSPMTAAHLLEAARSATDIFLFSHGWNNTFEVALTRYRDFIDHYLALREEHQLPLPVPYRPVLFGVVWPSTRFVFPWEDGPDIAAAGSPEVEELRQFVTESLDPAPLAEFSELTDGVSALTEAQARRAVELVHAALVETDDEGAISLP